MFKLAIELSKVKCFNSFKRVEVKLTELDATSVCNVPGRSGKGDRAEAMLRTAGAGLVTFRLGR
jgi:hypothetical protein